MTTHDIINENYITVNIRDTEFLALLDTGAVKTLLSEELAQRLGVDLIPLDSTDISVLYAADGSPMPVRAKTTLAMNISGVKVRQEVQVIQKLNHLMILGCDFLRQSNAVIDFGKHLVSFADTAIEVPIHTVNRELASTRPRYAITVESVCIPAFNEALVSVTVPRDFDGQAVLLEPIPEFQFKKFASARAITRCSNSRALCKIMNYSPNSMTLHRGKKVAAVESLSVIDSCSPYQELKPEDNERGMEICNKQTSANLENFAREYGLKLSPHLTSEQRQQMLQLLWDYQDIFARSLEEITQYPHFELGIDLLSNRKVYRRQFQLHPEDAKEVERQIDLMLKNNIIEKSDCYDVNSCVFLVNKKSGEKRMVVDLRNLNAVIAPKLIQLPRIDDILDEVTLQKSTHLSSLDLFSGFWQVKLEKNARKYTTFTCPVSGEKYCFRVVPFGLCSAPSAMILVLNAILKGELRRTTYAYLDDLVIIGKDWNDHLKNLENTFNQLQKNKLKCNPAKCGFGFDEIEFLGFKISAKGIRISDSKVKIIRKIVAPKTKKSLQRLLGLFCYFRKYIKDYAQRTFHMRNLLTKDTPFRWTVECQQELDYLKDCLLKEPILSPLDPNKDLVIQCDASTKGYAFVVMQPDENKRLKVVFYGGNSITNAQKSYPPAELELIGLSLALKSVDFFAVHRKVTVFTDNARVLYLQKWQPLNNRQKRLIAYLMQFSLDIRYIKGAKNYTADTLSRVYEDMSFEERLEFAQKRDDTDDFILTLTDCGGKTNTSKPRRESRKQIHPRSPEIQLGEPSADDLDRLAPEPSGELEAKNINNQVTPAVRAKTSTLRPTALAFQPRDALFSTLPDSGSKQQDSKSSRMSHSEPTANDVENTQQSDCSKQQMRIEPDELDSLEAQQQTDSKQSDDILTPLAGLVDEDTTEVEALDDRTTQTHEIAKVQLQARDYLQDEEFQNMYVYLTDGQLSGDEKKDKKTLLLAEQFFIRDDILYRLKLPRNKKEQVLFSERVCVPKLYRYQILFKFHDSLGHFGAQKIFLSLSNRFYWQSMFNDVADYVKSCDLCLRSKRNYNFRSSPLNPLQVFDAPGCCWHLDFKNLPRATKNGNVGILCCIDAFTGWPVLVAVPDLSAYTAARMFFKYVIAVFGVPTHVMTDRGSSFTAEFFSHIMKLFNIKHRMSASRAPRSNGLAESLVKRVSELVKRLCEKDTDIEDALPAMEFSLRATNHTRIPYSPFQLCFGQHMKVGEPIDVAQPIPFTGDYKKYVEMLRSELQTLHEQIKVDKMVVKAEDKARYDAKNKVQEPTWYVGQMVLLEDRRVKPHSDVVLTHKPYVGPFYITEIIQGDANIGSSYRLIDVKTGKTFRYLVTKDRLKRYDANRADLSVRMPVSIGNRVNDSWPQSGQNNHGSSGDTKETEDDTSQLEPAIKILKQRVRQKKREYLVLFVNKTKFWCDIVTPALLQEFRLRQQRQRNRRRENRIAKR